MSAHWKGFWALVFRSGDLTEFGLFVAGVLVLAAIIADAVLTS